ncbi:MAG: hypothetical protein ACK46X_16330 [Candidatus Sericytochromatia bacterium]
MFVRRLTLLLVLATVAGAPALMANAPALAAPAANTNAYKALTLKEAMPKLRKEVFRGGNEKRVIPLKDGTLTYTAHRKDDYDQGYELRFSRPGLTVADAKAIVKLLQDEPVFLDKPKPFAGGVAFKGQEWEATGDSTIEARFYMRGPVVTELVLKKNQSAE